MKKIAAVLLLIGLAFNAEGGSPVGGGGGGVGIPILQDGLKAEAYPSSLLEIPVGVNTSYICIFSLAPVKKATHVIGELEVAISSAVNTVASLAPLSIHNPSGTKIADGIINVSPANPRKGAITFILPLEYPLPIGVNFFVVVSPGLGKFQAGDTIGVTGHGMTALDFSENSDGVILFDDTPFKQTVVFLSPPSASASITVLSPNGGETWALGSTQTIRWSSQNIAPNPKSGVDILLSWWGGDAQGTPQLQIGTRTSNDGIETITIPANLFSILGTKSGNYKVELVATVTDESGTGIGIVKDASDGFVTITSATPASSSASAPAYAPASSVAVPTTPALPSPEWLAEVTALYNKHFCREPDAGGLEFFWKRWQNNLDQIEREITTSYEYFLPATIAKREARKSRGG